MGRFGIRKNSEEFIYFRNVVFDVAFCQKSIDAGTSLLRVHDSMKSFPSGHSQLALFAGLFIFVSFLLLIIKFWKRHQYSYKGSFDPILSFRKWKLRNPHCNLLVQTSSSKDYISLAKVINTNNLFRSS